MHTYMAGFQNHGPFLASLNFRCRTIFVDPKRDHNFDNHSYTDELHPAAPTTALQSAAWRRRGSLLRSLVTVQGVFFLSSFFRPQFRV